MMQEYGRLMVSLFLLIILQSWNTSKNFLLSWQFPSNMNGGFPLSAPLLLWVMTLILEAAAAMSPVGMLVCSAIGGSTAAAGAVCRGISMPCCTAASIWGRMGP